jgi:predicted nuclease of predicted toxin-antitoxin system
VKKNPVLKFFLDHNVPASVGRVLQDSGHTVLYLTDVIAENSPDQLVCAVAEANDCILVGHDGDMRQLAQRHGVGQRRFRKLSLIKLSCRETRSAQRVSEAMTLIEHEWEYSAASTDRRIFIEIGDSVISTKR